MNYIWQYLDLCKVELFKQKIVLIFWELLINSKFFPYEIIGSKIPSFQDVAVIIHKKLGKTARNFNRQDLPLLR